MVEERAEKDHRECRVDVELNRHVEEHPAGR